MTGIERFKRESGLSRSYGLRFIPTFLNIAGCLVVLPSVPYLAQRRRLQQGISQEELGFRTDLHRTYISQLERGLMSPSLKIITRLALRPARAI